MTRVDFLEALKGFTEAAVADMMLPARLQKGDAEQKHMPAQVFLMRIKNEKAADKKAPYILHQIVTGKDSQESGYQVECQAVVRSIFCVYNEDEGEGGMMLLGLMERLRIELLRKVVIGKRYELDLEAGLEILIYPEDTAPYYVGEMLSRWSLPRIKREVS